MQLISHLMNYRLDRLKGEDLLSQKATGTKTRSYLEKFPQLSPNSFGKTGLLCSQVGFGAYRLHSSINEHKLALQKALLNGINLIDSSANYSDGKSEELIGQVLTDLINQKQIERESVIIVTKGGYLQGRNYQYSQQCKQSGKPWPELVEYGPGIEHCIHPLFIEDQLERSLKRLQLKSIDVYLLHNPEYYLSWAHKMDIPLTQNRQEYLLRIENAFRYLEKEVRRGRIHFYGISSNTFPGHTTDPNFTPLEAIWNIAEHINPRHHFKVIQMPMNLIEHQAVTNINQPTMQSAIEFACEKGLAVLINRPLNAYVQRRLFRLVDITGDLSPALNETENFLNELIRQENYFDRYLMDTFEFAELTKKKIQELFSTGSYLAINWQKLGPYHQWIDSQVRILVDRINQGMEILSSRPDLTSEQKKWIDFYVETFNHALDGLTARYKIKAAKETGLFKKEIQSIDKQWDEAHKMSHKAIRSLRTTRGVSCVLVGMRHENYVADVLEELKHPVEVRDGMHSWLALKEQLKGLKFE